MSQHNSKKNIPFQNSNVANIFDTYPKTIKEKLTALRSIIFEVASKHTEIGELEETLKWGQPSYLTPHSKSGSTIRIDQIKTMPGHYAIYFHCQTNLVETFRTIFPSQFSYQCNRAIIFNINHQIPQKELKQCILLALTYHLNKK